MMQEFCLNIDAKRFRVIAAVYRPEGPRRTILEAAGILVVPITDDTLQQVVEQYHVDVVHAHKIRVSHLVRNVPVLEEVVFIAAMIPMPLSISSSAKPSRQK